MGTKRPQRTAGPAAYEQLTLLAPTNVPLQFRLDERTRRRGLAHIAEIRRQLAVQAARRQNAMATVRAPRRRAA